MKDKPTVEIYLWSESKGIHELWKKIPSRGVSNIQAFGRGFILEQVRLLSYGDVMIFVAKEKK